MPTGTQHARLVANDFGRRKMGYCLKGRVDRNDAQIGIGQHHRLGGVIEQLAMQIELRPGT